MDFSLSNSPMSVFTLWDKGVRLFLFFYFFRFFVGFFIRHLFIFSTVYDCIENIPCDS